MAMMAMTTRSSISVKARRRCMRVPRLSFITNTARLIARVMAAAERRPREDRRVLRVRVEPAVEPGARISLLVVPGVPVAGRHGHLIVVLRVHQIGQADLCAVGETGG